MKAADWPRPAWQVPYPYGFASSLDSAGTTAAPLLAGFSITLIGLVISNPEKLRWPDQTLILLTASAALLIVAIQCAASARQYVVTPNELAAWWPDATNDARWKQLRREQWGHFDLLDLWARRFRRAFHSGLVVLLTALAVLLFPPTTDEAGNQTVECPRFRGHLSAWSALSGRAGRIAHHVHDVVSQAVSAGVSA